jgi:phosphatidylinositol alpha-1,6-mannosyltransferase
MRVLMLAENWPPRVGGIENYLSAIAEHLPKGSVTVVAPTSSYKQEAIPYTLIRSRFFWPLIKPAWLPLFIKLWRQLKKEPVDIVLCGKGLFEGLIGYYLKRHLGIPYIVFTYAMEIETWADGGQRRRLIRVLTHADRVAYINDTTKNTLKDLGVTDQQLVKIWPGAHDRFFEDIAEEQVTNVLAHYQVQQPYILSVARLIPRKGLDTLIEGFSQLDQLRFGTYQLVIVGNGPEAAALRELAERSMISPRVKVLTEVSDDDLPALYRGADVFALTPRVLPGDFEGFGIVYLEAAAQGIPAIATHTGGAGEAVVHKETGLVIQPDAPSAVQEALKHLLDNEGLRRELGAKAKQRAYDQFRWRKRILLVKGTIDAVVSARKQS